VPPVFAPQQSRAKRPPAEERETKVLPLDSNTCSASDTTIIDFTSAQVLARCDSTESTTRLLVTVIPRTPDPADYLRALSLRFCGEVIDAGAPSGWQTEIERENARAGVAADVRWELVQTGYIGNTLNREHG